MPNFPAKKSFFVRKKRWQSSRTIRIYGMITHIFVTNMVYITSMVFVVPLGNLLLLFAFLIIT